MSVMRTRLHAQPVAVLGLVVACAKYRNGFRVEQCGEIAYAVTAASSRGGAGRRAPGVGATVDDIVVPVM